MAELTHIHHLSHRCFRCHEVVENTVPVPTFNTVMCYACVMKTLDEYVEGTLNEVEA